jgi:dimethylargininase
MKTLALTRAVSPTIIHCELTHLARSPIDPIRADEQHRAYEDLLVSLGCIVERVEPAPELPDAVFIEDTAIVLPEIAIITRPGAASRRPEARGVADKLAPYRKVARLESAGIENATLDGGDVLCIGHT